MAQTRRRAYPTGSRYTETRPDSKYGSRGNARHKNVRNKDKGKKQRSK